ncbi:hypothetical protein ACEUZ9_002823 [Paracoccus litorisediminis]|uniref:hypothetical protein n=1 Tax=Paracoccus litorisediminis TaxID=2006130 RepID=UPI00372E7F01
MPKSVLQKMKSINVQLATPVIRQLDAMPHESRSEAIRVILAAILNAREDGNHAPLDLACTAARRSAAPVRRILTDANLLQWKKTIVWIPEAMLEVLEEIEGETRLRVADLIRGAVLGMFSVDASALISAEGHEAWMAAVQA